MPKYVGNRCIPIPEGNWDKTKSYEALSVVLADNGDSYTSRKAVPQGIELSDTTYWVVSSRFNAQLDIQRQRIDKLDSTIDNLDSTKASKTELDVERKRINQMTKLPDGSTTGDAELADIRIGANGKTYDTAGAAVRSQISTLNKDTKALNSTMYRVEGAVEPESTSVNVTLIDNSIASHPSNKVALYPVDDVLYVATKYGYQFRTGTSSDSAVSTYLGAYSGFVATELGAKYVAVELDETSTKEYGAFSAVNEIKEVKNSQLKLDANLEEEGKAADAKAVGEAVGQLKEDINDLKSSGNESLIVIYDILSKGTYIEDISSLMSQLDGLVHNGMYKITSDVKNATLSNKSNYVTKGSKYKCTVTASLGYKIFAVVVTMGGVDISSNYDATTKTITIESVTGDINITVTTIETDYTSLQYIKGDGNSWIDTGVVANVNHRYELSAKLDGDDADEYFFGADQYNVGSAYNQFVMRQKATHTKITGTINRNGNIDVGTWNVTENNLLSNKKMYLVVKNGSQEIYLNSSYTEKQSHYTAGSASFGSQDTMPIIPLYLFHVNTTSSTNPSIAKEYKRSKITVYWLKIYDDTTNEMLHEFLPVAKNGKIGMLDTVTKEFHANIGTGTFAYEEV